MEKKLQSEIARWLRDNGVYVLTTRVLPGVPAGCPDIIGLYKNKWIAIEVKRSANAPFRPGQVPTLTRLGAHNDFVYVVYPEVWEKVKAKIATHFL